MIQKVLKLKVGPVAFSFGYIARHGHSGASHLVR